MKKVLAIALLLSLLGATTALAYKHGRALGLITRVTNTGAVRVTNTGAVRIVN